MLAGIGGRNGNADVEGGKLGSGKKFAFRHDGLDDVPLKKQCQEMTRYNEKCCVTLAGHASAAISAIACVVYTLSCY